MTRHLEGECRDSPKAIAHIKSGIALLANVSVTIPEHVFGILLKGKRRLIVDTFSRNVEAAVSNRIGKYMPSSSIVQHENGLVRAGQVKWDEGFVDVGAEHILRKHILEK